MTGKEKLAMVLSGGVPETPPHWELVFQIEKEMFGVDLETMPEADRNAAQIDVYGYQSVDPQGHMDIQQVRKQYPDWILMGNVACNMLQDTNDERIRESVRYCMTHGGVGKPYIFSTSNCIFKGMPPESYRTMWGEYKRIVGEGNE